MKNFFIKLKNVIKSIDWLNIDAKTYAAYIMMALTIINRLSITFGWNPIEASESDVYTAISDILMAVVFIRNTWMNNSVTDKAIKADEYLEYIKEKEEKEKEEELSAYAEESEDETTEG
jgi:SPP1 family holin